MYLGKHVGLKLKVLDSVLGTFFIVRVVSHRDSGRPIPGGIQGQVGRGLEPWSRAVSLPIEVGLELRRS